MILSRRLVIIPVNESFILNKINFTVESQIWVIVVNLMVTVKKPRMTRIANQILKVYQIKSPFVRVRMASKYRKINSIVSQSSSLQVIFIA